MKASSSDAPTLASPLGVTIASAVPRADMPFRARPRSVWPATRPRFRQPCSRRRLSLLYRRALLPLRYRGRGGGRLRSRPRTGSDWPGFAEHYRPHLAPISHLVLYNSGSVLNPREMPPDLLDEIVTFARSLPAVRVDLARLARGLHQAQDSQTHLCRFWATDSRFARFWASNRPTIASATMSSRKQCHARPSTRRIPRPGHDSRPNSGRTDRSRRQHRDRRPGNHDRNGRRRRCTDSSLRLDAGAEHGVNVDLNLHPYYPGSRGLRSLSRSSALFAGDDRPGCRENRRAGSIDEGRLRPFHRLERRGPRPRARAARPGD